MKLPSATTPVALASLAALGLQVAVGLVLLHRFQPAVVGTFSVVAQVAFYWMTLALAQAPLKLLADAHQPARAALLRNLRASLLRWLILLPLVALAVWTFTPPPHLSTLAWAVALGLLQLGWYLAQPLTLRAGSTRSVVLVRLAPPLLTFGLVVGVGWWHSEATATGLLLAAALGYALGSAWLLTVPPSNAAGARIEGASPAQEDGRSATLRLAHAAMDALAGTAVLLVWHRFHGPEEAGYLAVLLRILGFVPALTHAAWAQVNLAQGKDRRRASVWAAAGGAMVTLTLVLACAGALHLGWLAPTWQGLGDYLWPLAAWQSMASALAALAHLPFAACRARAFSRMAIAYNVWQLTLLCIPAWLLPDLTPATHASWLGYGTAAALGVLCLWMARMRAP